MSAARVRVVQSTLGALAACAVLAASVNARADIAPPEAMDAASPVTTTGDAATTTTTTAADASTHTTTPVTTTTNTGAGACSTYNSVQCSGKSVGESCQVEDGESGNCGDVSCNGDMTHTCIASKGSEEGGCNVGAADIGSTFAVLALLAPFAALRRKRRAGASGANH